MDNVPLKLEQSRTEVATRATMARVEMAIVEDLPDSLVDLFSPQWIRLVRVWTEHTHALNAHVRTHPFPLFPLSSSAPLCLSLSSSLTISVASSRPPLPPTLPPTTSTAHNSTAHRTRILCV